MRMIRIIALTIVVHLAAALTPLARAHAAPAPAKTATPPAETIAEAMFLCDALPPGGRDLTLSVAVAPDAARSPSGAPAYGAAPRMQLAMALGERLGFTADVGLGTNGSALDAPGASLKVLLREPGPERTGVAFSADLFGGSHDPVASEIGLGLGAIRALGRMTIRAGASAATPVNGFAPHLHAGASAALALGARVRVLGEVVTEVTARETSWAAGPTVKVALSERASASAGMLVPLAYGPPTFAVQVAHGL